MEKNEIFKKTEIYFLLSNMTLSGIIQTKNSKSLKFNYNVKLAQNCTRALINASIKGYFDIVYLLLNYGVNPNRIDIITGTGPLHEAVRYNDSKDDKTQLERIKIVQFLAAYGADPELANIKREVRK